MKKQILTEEQRNYMTVYAQRLAQLTEYAAEIEAGDEKNKAAALDICTWMRKQGDNPAFLAGQIGEAIEPTTPEKIAATIAKPSYFGQPPKVTAKTYDEIIRDGVRGRD